MLCEIAQCHKRKSSRQIRFASCARGRRVNPTKPFFTPRDAAELQRSMSALGQKQTLQRVRPMSALPPKADIGTQPPDVRFVPKADVGLLTQVPTVESGLRKPPFKKHIGTHPRRVRFVRIAGMGPAAITKGNKKKRFDPVLCDSPGLIQPEQIELSP